MSVEGETDPSLVAALRAGDPAAFDQVYEQYRTRLFSFLIRLARRRDVAEDLLEETWLRLVSHASRLEPGTRLGPWLFTVARNLYWSYCRSRMVEDHHAGQLIGLWPAGLRSRSPLEEAVGSELERRVERALGDLPSHYREALMLVAFEELTPAEAASVCGISPVALRQRLSRARAMLAAALATPEPRGTRPKEHEDDPR